MKRGFRMSKVMLLTLFAFLTTTAMAQTPAQRTAISSKYNQAKLKELQRGLSSRQAIEKSQALELARVNGWSVTYRVGEFGVAELMKLDAAGSPLYFQTHNVDASVSTRTNHLNIGGSLGLDLDGQGMTAYVWDGGAIQENHVEFDGPGGSNRAQINDGVTVMGDNSYHAQHVTGTIIGYGADAQAKGMAPQADALTHDWNNDLSEMVSAAASGMLVSNHSYGYAWRNSQGRVQLSAYYGGGYVVESREIDEILYNAPYYLMVSSAGNDGEDDTANTNPLDGNSQFDKLTAYSTAKNNLVVAAAEDVNTNADGTINGGVTIATFSSEGPTDDYRIKPDITGNGVDLYSTFNPEYWANLPTSSQYYGGGYEYLADYDYWALSGTSMSGPNVAGSILLLQQHYNNLYGTFMRSATLKGVVLHTADDAGLSGPDAIFGWGLLNAKTAAETISNDGVSSIVDELTLASGESYQITVDATGGPLMASISWTDPAGTAYTTANLRTPVLVNDLDIRVTQGNSTYFPYALTGVNSNAQQDNLVDPFERVDVNNASGTYTITVTNKGSLSGGSQDFSLIVTGVAEGDPVVCEAVTPAGVAVSGVTSSVATVSWESVPDVSYEVTYGVVGTNATTTAATTSTSYTITGLSAATAYEVQVRSLCDDSVSPYSSAVSFTTPEASAEPVVLIETGFETGWEGWVSGGSDAARSTYGNTPVGDYSVRIRDDMGEESAITYSDVDVSGFAGLEVSFLYYPNNVETGEDFWLVYYNGSSWETIETFVAGTDYENNAVYSATVTMSASDYNFASDAGFRIQCDASENNDRVFLDEIVVTGLSEEVVSGSSNTMNANSLFAAESEENNLELLQVGLYPNPSSSEIYLTGVAKGERLFIYTTSGHEVLSTLYNGAINVSTLKRGIYFVSLESGEVLRFVKE